MERSTRSPPRHSTTTERVVKAVATYTDTDPLELPPLYDSLDSDALDAVTHGLSNGTVQFQYADHSVTVHGDGTVEIADDPTTRSEQSDVAADD